MKLRILGIANKEGQERVTAFGPGSGKNAAREAPLGIDPQGTSKAKNG